MADYLRGVLEIVPAGGSAVQTDEARKRWFELGLVLLVACGGSLVNALYVLKYGPAAGPLMIASRWMYGTVQETSALLLLGYVLSRRGLRMRDIGLRWTLRDVGAGLLLAGLSFAVYLLSSAFIQLFHHWIYGTLAASPDGKGLFARPSVAGIPFFLLNPFFEELIVRAYLMSEIIELSGSSKLAVATSVLVPSSYHLYYGWIGAFSLSFQFLVFAIYYVRSRRALPIIIAHGVFDIYGLVRLW